MKTAVRTANRICSRYWRKAVRLPIGRSPLSTRDRAEPHDGDRREVEDRGHHRDRHREQPVDLQAVLEQVPVRVVEALLLVLGPHERADDADAGQRLAHDLVDPVELGLHGPEQRDGPAHDEADEAAPSSAGPRPAAPTAGTSWRSAMMMPPTIRIGRRDHQRQRHEDDRLDLLDVVRVAGDQRRRAETVDLDLGEASRPCAKMALRTSRPKPIAIRAPK